MTHLKLKDPYPLDEQQHDVVRVHLLRELGDDLGRRVVLCRRGSKGEGWVSSDGEGEGGELRAGLATTASREEADGPESPYSRNLSCESSRESSSLA